MSTHLAPTLQAGNASPMHGIISPALFDLVGRIASLHSLSTIWSAYIQAARDAGLPHGIVLITSGTRPMRERLLGATMPDGWLENYQARNYETVCPLMPRARAAERPFRWHAQDWDNDAGPQRRAWRDDTIASGIRGGIGVPCMGHGENRAILLGGDRPDLHPDDRRTLHYAGLAALQRMQELSAPHAPLPALSARERECLTWVAAGKSDWEIGEILTLSNKTVNIYIERAKHKLGAATRVQAVVKALQDGQITL